MSHPDRPTHPRPATRPAAHSPRAHSPNLHPSGLDELMPKTLATATVDRLMHHAHVGQTSGDSIRLTRPLAGKGVIPLN
jgi:DNA replication protein DnaC